MNVILVNEINRIKQENNCTDLNSSDLLKYGTRLYNVVYTEENEFRNLNLSEELLVDLHRIYDTYKSIDAVKLSTSYSYFTHSYNTLEPTELYNVLSDLNKFLKLDTNKLYELVYSMISPFRLLNDKFNDEYNNYLNQIVRHNYNYPIESLKDNIDFQLSLPPRPISVIKQIELTKLKQSLIPIIYQKNELLKIHGEQLNVILTPPITSEYTNIIKYFTESIAEITKEINEKETLISDINSILNQIPTGVTFRNEYDLLRMETMYKENKNNIKRAMTKDEYWIFKDFYNIHTL
jgi:hypothetical protein